MYSDTPSHNPLRLGIDLSDGVEQRYSQVARSRSKVVIEDMSFKKNRLLRI